MASRGFCWVALISLACFATLPFQPAAVTDQNDVNALNALSQAWQSTALQWSGDPCEGPWFGVSCDDSNTRVVELILPNQNLKGNLPGVVGNLTELTILDLSYNGNLNGELPLEIGNLVKLEELSLQYCNFSGSIPSEIGNVQALTFLSLKQNSFTGPLPPSIGRLVKLFWFDVSNNKLSGSLPVSTTGGGLDTLTDAQHFHLQNNSFSGNIPSEIFNPNMSLIHLLLQNNFFNGSIPLNIGNLTQLNILRLDYNGLSGTIPASTNELQNLTAIQLNNNSLNGILPELSNLSHLQFLNLSYNNFETAEIPPWLTSFADISLISMEAGNLIGEIPANLLSIPSITKLMFGFNQLNGTLDLGNVSSMLTEIDLEMNNISKANIHNYSGTLKLQGNPVCNNQNLSDDACSSSSLSSLAPSSSPLSAPSQLSLNCTCSEEFAENPTASGCTCAYPISGSIVFPALNIDDVSSIIPVLKNGFVVGLNLTSPDQLQLTAVNKNQLEILIFPFNNVYWDQVSSIQIYHKLSSQEIEFLAYGTYSFFPWYYYLLPESVSSGLSTGAKIGIGIGVAVLVIVILVVGFYAVMQKQRAYKAEELNKPFAAWIVGGDTAAAPKLKGSQLFSYVDIMKATRNFSESNEIGVGGYGKVYIGVLQSGQQVAVKRAKASSMQGAAEFKTEIELLSRVHHRNLVGLVGFCFEQGEQILVYEYMPNGTLRDCLSGRNGVLIDWQRRLNFALDAAKGIAYLHSAANPPIIHRDIKSGNILLDDKLVAKVADFGLSVLVPDDDGSGQGHISTQVKGTLGYLDPEYYTTQQLTEKSDVYSFGVVLLELITAKQPIEHGNYIVRTVRTALGKGGTGLHSIVDSNLKEYPENDIESILDLALRCVKEEGAYRPTMDEIIKELEALAHSSPDLNKVETDINYHSKDGPIYSQPDSQMFTDSPFKYSGSYGITGVTVEPK